jgi:hypothetical protein
MKQFAYVEEYLEFIAGIRDATGKVITRFLPQSPVSLARYDVKFVESVGAQVASDALTDRQADLALKIIAKYERQLQALGVAVEKIVTVPAYRQPLREIDRSRRLMIEADVILLQFPYDDNMIKDIKSGIKDTQGSMKFNRDRRAWTMALTEYNLNYAVTFAESHQFEIDARARELMQLIFDAEKQPYRIELTTDGHQLSITNAESSLVEYININLGGFGLGNIMRLVDHARILGYTVDSTLEQYIIDQTNARVYNLMVNRDSKLNAQDSVKIAQSFDDIVLYAQQSNRWPIYIYEPSLRNDLLALAGNYFGSDEIVSVTKTISEIKQTIRVVHITKYASKWNLRIPLLVTANGMLFGGEKQMLLECAEKVVYLAHEVYNHSHRGADTVVS